MAVEVGVGRAGGTKARGKGVHGVVVPVGVLQEVVGLGQAEGASPPTERVPREEAPARAAPDEEEEALKQEVGASPQEDRVPQEEGPARGPRGEEEHRRPR